MKIIFIFLSIIKQYNTFSLRRRIKMNNQNHLESKLNEDSLSETLKFKFIRRFLKFRYMLHLYYYIILLQSQQIIIFYKDVFISDKN